MFKFTRMAIVAMALTLASCPKMPAPDGCTPNDQRCHEGRPQVCSGSQRWGNADEVCTEHGEVCCLTQSEWTHTMIFACAPPDRCSEQDGGAP